MRAGFFILLFLSQTTFGQFSYSIDQSIPVSLSDDTPLSMPWAGGLNATHYNTMDLNDDGHDDLVIFDRTASRVITFLNDNSQYRYAPEYESFFPSSISGWLLLRDYNGDGKKDIFTGNNQDISVYTNITSAGGNPTWKLFLFYTGVGPKSNVLMSLGLTNKLNVHLNADDLPAISDADGDGDLDLFVPRYPGGDYIELHKNLSKERYGTLDSLDFERSPQQSTPWGGVTECHCGEFAFNGEPCDEEGRVARTEHAGGKNLFAFDVDSDGDQDMLLSETECSVVFLLKNDGTDAAPLITSATPYPATYPASMVIYPAAFYEDVDFDGVKDLIATPDLYAREYVQTNFRRSVWFYKNSGTTELPVFNTPVQNFMQGRMIDTGDDAVPAFFDADGDGDLDLFVSNYLFNISSSIYFYENTGTVHAPAFRLVSTDFMNLSSYNYTNVRPFFADMNGDTKIDLVFTASTLFGTTSRLYYMPNSNGVGVNFSSGVRYTGFQVSAQENICVADVNRDGKNDLLVGKQSGALEYWQNTGTAINPFYTLADNSFLGLGSSIFRFSPSCATADLNGDGKPELIFGDQTARGTVAGKLTIIDNYREAADASNAVSDILYNPITESLVSQNLGGKIWPTVANIFKEDKPSIIVGNSTGGLHVLKPASSINLPEAPIIDVYPNPVAKTSILTVKTDRPAAVIMMSALGQEMRAPIFLQAFQEYSFQMNEYAQGIYLLYFVIEGKSIVRKIAVD